VPNERRSGLGGRAAADARAPIGVFDSGVGGLTVLAALRERLPQERFLYLGDTARLPYGTKSPETVVRYALQAADVLVARGVKALVVACNTASSVALPAMAERFGPLPLMGVVEPGAAAAAAASRSGDIAVIATEATVRGGAYQRAIDRRRPGARIHALACQLFVALAEEGWTDGPIAQAVAERYLAPWFAPREASGAQAHTQAQAPSPAPGGPTPDTLVLGCTHFPMLRAPIRRVIGDQVALIDSAVTTAEATRTLLQERGVLAPLTAGAAEPRQLELLATDGVERFAAVGSRFIGRRIAPTEVELVDL